MIKKKVDSLNAQYGAYVLLFCAMVSTLAVVIGIAQLRANAAQDRQRVQDNASLLECVSNWGSSLTATLPPIRKASQARDDALADALSGQKGLRGALTKVSGGNFTPADLADLIRALNALQKADTELRAARAANPYPPPPSLTCDLP